MRKSEELRIKARIIERLEEIMTDELVYIALYTRVDMGEYYTAEPDSQSKTEPGGYITKLFDQIFKAIEK